MRIGGSTTNPMRGVIVCRTHCPHCGRELNRRTIHVFGKDYEVTDYGSCGCEESKWDGENVVSADRKYVKAGIPKRYLKATAQLNGWDEAIESGSSLFISGNFGVGKTWFACALAKRLIDNGATVRFENSKHLLTEMQGMFDGRKTDALDRAFNCRVLVLDDIGKEQATPYAISMLYELVDSRYAAAKPIVCTSNFTRGELLQRWSSADAATAESIVSRLCDGAESMRMDGEDRRLA